MPSLLSTGVILAQGQVSSDTSLREKVLTGLEDTATKGGFTPSANPQDALLGTVTRGVGYFIGIIGVVIVIMIIYAGFLWLTAGGNDDQVAQAKTMIKNAVYGLIVVSLAYAVVAFVSNFIIQN